jgi:hypothetical protein
MRAVVVLLALTATASANVAQPRFPGTPAGEPNGLHDIAIAREDLVLDLEPLVRGEPVQIRATYHLANHGDESTASLVFVSGSRDAGAAGARVTLDDQAVQTTDADDEQRHIPDAWRPPATTPGFEGESRPYEVKAGSMRAFTLAIPRGEHVLAVSYDATASLDRRSGDTLVWQLAYILAPARDWAGFGTLDLAVRVPDGWELAISPPLDDSGHQTFTGLPADAIALTTRARTGALHGVLGIVLPLLVVVVVIAGVAGLVSFGRSRRQALRSAWPFALAGGVAWGAAIAVAGVLAAMASTFAIPPGQEASHGYAIGFGMVIAVLGGVVATPIGFAIVMVASRRGH